MKKGTRVRMSEELKRLMGGKCREAGEHLGPFDLCDKEVCWACSWEHVKEFEDCTGIVIGPVEWGSGTSGPEVDVRWQPSNLRYAYLPDRLVKA